MDVPKTIFDLKNGIINKDFSYKEIVKYYLKRIEKYDININSFITVLNEKSLKDAERCDKIIESSGKDIFLDHPLFGVSVSIKDIFSTKGIRTTAGSKLLDNYIPPYNATVIDKLESSGCILMGKTNCDAWAHGTSGENSDYGATKNPWNYDYVPGGSSSGSAAALASEFTLASIGSDTGGSVRQPANFCGVVGLKPTYGAISRYGLIAMSSSFDTVGIFSNNVSDSKEIFSVLKGVDIFDSTSKNINNKSNKKKYYLGIPKEYLNDDNIDEEVKKEFFRVVELFNNNGIEVKEISLPHTKYAISVYYIIQPAEVSSNLGRFDGIRFGNKRDQFSPEAKRRIILGTYVLSAGYYDKYYVKALNVRENIKKDFTDAFDKVDAILAPVSPTTAFKIGEKISDPLKMYLADIYTVAANVSGIPSLALPSALSSNNLPMGFQIMANYFNEELLFNLGKVFENINHSKHDKPKLL